MERKQKKSRAESEEVTEKIVLEELYGEANRPFPEGEEDDPEKTEKLDLNEIEDEEPKQTAKKSKKKSTKAKTVEEEDDEDFDEEEDEELEASPKKKTSRKKNKLTPDPVSPDIVITSTTMQKNMEMMVKQWDALKEISNTITNNFQKVSDSLGNFQTNQDSLAKELAKPSPATPPPRQAPSHKLATGMSLLALILAFISLVFSQSIRRDILDKNLVTKEAAVAEKSPVPDVATRYVAPHKVKKTSKPNSPFRSKRLRRRTR